ncbi:MAG: hypothetical protein LBL27_03365, partial [Coriobacteriales bacterium]|nr:hypothetical protein [Coriobacteriales bacterium]
MVKRTLLLRCSPAKRRVECTTVQEPAMIDIPFPKTGRKRIREYPLDHKNIPLVLKVFGGLCVLMGLSVVVFSSLHLSFFTELIRLWLHPENSKTTIIIYAIMLVCLAFLVITPTLLGIRLLMNRRRHAALLVNSLIGIVIVTALCDVMLFGL